VGSGNDGSADLSGLRAEVEAGRVRTLYVIDPGPGGSFGDLRWLIEARRSGVLAQLAVQGVVASELTEAADLVLPGATSLEKDAMYTNDQGRVQAASSALTPPGDAHEDWRILVAVGRALGVALPYQSAADVRAALSDAMPDTPYAEAARLSFARPVPARHWLEASNPSERWKWDFLYQDLPPVKGHSVQMEGVAPPGAYIPLTPVE
jgi:predicted molibdopterin-dependent oxidoreductase YjgC